MSRSTVQKEADRRYEKTKGKERQKRYRDSKKEPKPIKTCSICGDTYYSKGLCNKHYQAQRRATKK